MDYETAMEHAARACSPRMVELLVQDEDGASIVTSVYVNAAHVVSVKSAGVMTVVRLVDGDVYYTTEDAESVANRLTAWDLSLARRPKT